MSGVPNRSTRSADDFDARAVAGSRAERRVANGDSHAWGEQIRDSGLPGEPLGHHLDYRPVARQRWLIVRPDLWKTVIGRVDRG